MNFFMKNMKKGTRNRIHFGTGSGSTFSKCGSEDPDADPLIRKDGSGSTFPKSVSQDPDPDSRQNEMDPKRCSKSIQLFILY